MNTLFFILCLFVGFLGLIGHWVFAYLYSHSRQGHFSGLISINMLFKSIAVICCGSFVHFWGYIPLVPGCFLVLVIGITMANLVGLVFTLYREYDEKTKFNLVLPEGNMIVQFFRLTVISFLGIFYPGYFFGSVKKTRQLRNGMVSCCLRCGEDQCDCKQ